MKLPLFVAVTFVATSLAVAEKPNILWIVSEDNGRDWLRLYHPSGAPMPRIERLAATGVTYEHAFSNAPVCSVARSTLITGCYAPRLAGQNHRKSVIAPMPEGLHMFPYYLRQAGYYTSNNSKEDYNLEKGEGVWDDSSREASYRNRRAGQPFFHVQNFGATHEGSLHFSRETMESEPTQTDPASVDLFPYHPDTETFRYTYARYHDRHAVLDQQIGTLIDQLKADGLFEDTVIFYFGDHGGALPRGKGYLYESGLQVPLVIRVPEKWGHLSPYEAGERAHSFVSFVDFAPSVLKLANIEPPAEMDGMPFLGSEIDKTELESRNRAFGYADRFDERFGFNRSLRVGNFKYIRNFMPFYPDGLQNNYRYQMLAYSEWRDLYRAGDLDAIQSRFFQPLPAEALYDLTEDPYETNNLARNPAYADELSRLRSELHRTIVELPDLSLFPESVIVSEAIANPVAFARSHKLEIAELLEVANLPLLPYSRAKQGIEAALESENPWERYWGLIVCSSFGESADSFARPALRLAASDPKLLVRARAAQFLALIGKLDPAPVITNALKASDDYSEAGILLNIATQLRDSEFEYTFDIDESEFPQDWLKNPQSNIKRRLDYLKGRL